MENAVQVRIDQLIDQVLRLLRGRLGVQAGDIVEHLEVDRGLVRQKRISLLEESRLISGRLVARLIIAWVPARVVARLLVAHAVQIAIHVI